MVLLFIVMIPLFSRLSGGVGGQERAVAHRGRTARGQGGFATVGLDSTGLSQMIDLLPSLRLILASPGPYSLLFSREKEEADLKAAASSMGEQEQAISIDEQRPRTKVQKKNRSLSF